MSILIAILGLALLIVLHEWGHFIVARLCGMRVERFSIGFGNPIVKFKRGDTIYQVAPIPLGGFVQITGMNPHEDFDKQDPYVYPNRPAWMRLAVLVAGPAANYLTAVLLAVGLFLGYGVSGETLTVAQVMPDTPAAAAGLRDGDILVSANGQKVSASAPITKVVKDAAGKPVVVQIVRGRSAEGQGGTPMTLTMTPKMIDGAYRLGVQIGQVREKVPVGKAVVSAFVMPVDLSGRILVGLWEMITGKQEAALSGPVGIAQEMAKAADRGVLDFLSFLTMLSVYLGLFNLLPLPALDGGRVIFVLFSAIGLKKITAKREATVHMVGLALLLGMMVIVTFNDVVKLAKRLIG